MGRKLAHIEQIIDINSIPDADKIEVCTVLGWKCVVGKGEFKIGDMIIYVEVDSIMPDKPEYEFLKSRKFRIRTIKLRKQISQGLVLPISTLSTDLGKFKIGRDVTKWLEVTKYLSPSEIKELERAKIDANKLKKYMMRYSWFRRLFLSRTGKQKFPFWVFKTDEERIQNIPQVLKQFKDYKCSVTEKIDYQSVTFTSKLVPRFNSFLGRLIPSKKVIFVIASRNLQVTDKNTLYWKIAKKYNLEVICKKYPGIIIQGEQGGPGVQANKYKLDEHKLFVFNIIKDGRFLDAAQMHMFCLNHNLEEVPFLDFIRLNQFGTVDELLKFAEGKSRINPDIEREGIVIRYIFDGKKILSFKAVSNKFLLKYD